jgi:hypothetical protein
MNRRPPQSIRGPIPLHLLQDRGARGATPLKLFAPLVWLSALALAACHVSDRDFCSQLADAPGCGGDTKGLCRDAIASEQSQPCADQVTALADCMASLELSCTSSSSISARGDGVIGGGQNFTQVGGFDVVVNDSECDVHRRGLEACRTCPDAAGAMEVDVRGIGDACEDADCAQGLVCHGAGVCTRSCESDDECKARADGCQLQVQYPNVCAENQCRRSCGDDFSCQAWVGDGSRCVDGACTLE